MDQEAIESWEAKLRALVMLDRSELALAASESGPERFMAGLALMMFRLLSPSPWRVNEEEAMRQALRGSISQLGEIEDICWLKGLVERSPRGAIQEGLDAALATAASSEMLENVAYLMTVATPLADESLALRASARAGRWAIVAVLAPVSDASAKGFEALGWAIADDELKLVERWSSLEGAAARVRSALREGEMDRSPRVMSWARGYLGSLSERESLAKTVGAEVPKRASSALGRKGL